MLGVDGGTAEGEPRDDVRLRLVRRPRPRPLLLLRRLPAGGAHPVCQGAPVEDDDPAPAELRRRPVAEQSLPPGGTGRPRRVVCTGCPADEQRRSESQRNGQK